MSFEFAPVEHSCRLASLEDRLGDDNHLAADATLDPETLWESGQLHALKSRLLAELAYSEQTGNHAELLNITNDLACVSRMLGETEMAATFQRQAAIREQAMLGSGNLSTTTLSNLACDALLAGDLPIAEGLFWKSLLAELAAGNDAGAAADWANLGLIASLQEDHKEARRRLWAALKLHRRSDDLPGLAMDLWHLGESFEATGAWNLAARLFERAERHFGFLGNREFQVASAERQQLAHARNTVLHFDPGSN